MSHKWCKVNTKKHTTAECFQWLIVMNTQKEKVKRDIQTNQQLTDKIKATIIMQ